MTCFFSNARWGGLADLENTPNSCLGAGPSGIAFCKWEKAGGRRVSEVEGCFFEMTPRRAN